MNIRTSRRGFLAGSGALVIGMSLPLGARAQGSAAPFAPNAFVRVAADDTVTVLVKHIEMGQGTFTGLTTLVAEEMDADWSQMRAEHAPAEMPTYVNSLFGVQGTGGSTSMASSYEVMRGAGAAARAMLVGAAADAWGVPEEEITVSAGRIAHEGSGNASGFGALAEAAAGRDVPSEPVLKDPSAFVLIGAGVPRLDSAAKSDGSAVFSIDVYREGMLTVAVLHPPAFGARLASFDAAPALAVPGVERVEEISTGLAVYATSTYPALRGRDALTAEWDMGRAETRSSERMFEIWAAAARSSGRVVEAGGDFDGAIGAAETVHEAEFRFPFLAHTPMETLDGVIEHDGASAEVWMGSQLQTVDHGTLAQVLGVPQEEIALHTTLTGGSFGRKAQAGSHFAAELAEVARAGGPGAYKLMWTREDDVRGGYYRPLTVHQMRAGLDAEGNLTAWENRIANQSIMAGGPFAQFMEAGLDPTSYEGSTAMPYDWPAHRVSWTQMEAGVPILWWRAVGHTHTAYATETFLDEVLAMGGRDRIEGRMALLKGDAGRDRGVLERVADMAQWSGPGTGARRMGVALHESFNTYVAMIAEVEDAGGVPRTTKVWCAVDCGVAINPDVIAAQIEGGVGFGLGAAMFSEITLAPGGRPVQSNWDDYRMLRMDEMPDVEVSIVESAAAPTGIGEPGVPPVAPAVANAWAAFGHRAPRRLPFLPAGAV
jgi:isoquinoline 1-oxidoreductase beta subunit